MTSSEKGHTPLREFVREHIKDPEVAAEYLNAAQAEGQGIGFLAALKDVVEVNGGLSELARKTKLNRSNLHKMLSGKGSPKLATVLKVLDASGFELTVKPQNKRA